MFDIRTLIHKPLGSSRYPDRKQINLYAKRSRRRSLIVKSLTCAAAMAFSVTFVQVFIRIPLKQADRAEQVYQNMENQLEKLRADHADAGKIKLEYAHYGSGHLTEREKALPDRIAMLAALEERILPLCSHVSMVSVTEDRMEVSCILSPETPLSDLIGQIEKEEAVRYVTVFRESAAGGETSEDGDGVSVDLAVYFAPAERKEP